MAAGLFSGMASGAGVTETWWPILDRAEKWVKVRKRAGMARAVPTVTRAMRFQRLGRAGAFMGRRAGEKRGYLGAGVARKRTAFSMTRRGVG